MLLFKPSAVLLSARSTKGIVRLSPSERALIKIPQEIQQVLIGILLGDGHISRRSSTANSRLIYAQTAVAHKEYFDYVFSLFLPFCVKDYIPQSKLVRDNRTKKTYSSISFTTMQLPCFNEYKNNFYVSGAAVKRVPDNIYLSVPLHSLKWRWDELLTPSPPGDPSGRGPVREEV